MSERKETKDRERESNEEWKQEARSEREGREGGRERHRACCSCNLDAQVVYRGACIFHCLVSPRCGAARRIRRRVHIHDVPVDVCIDEKIASVPTYRGRLPSAMLCPFLSLSLSPPISCSPHFFCVSPFFFSPFLFFSDYTVIFLRCTRNAYATVSIFPPCLFLANNLERRIFPTT